MSAVPPLTGFAAPAQQPNYLAQALARLNAPPPNLFPTTGDPNDPWARVRGMPRSTPGKTTPPTQLNRYGYAPLSATLPAPTPSTPPGTPPAAGAPPSDNAAATAYGNATAPDVDAALARALQQQEDFQPYQEQQTPYTAPVKDPRAQAHGIAGAIELLAAARSPKIMPALSKGIEAEHTERDKDYNERVQRARDEYQQRVDEQTRLERQSASQEALIDKRVQVAEAAKNLHDATLEKSKKDEWAHQIASKRADSYASSVISQNARRSAMTKEQIARDQETARYHAEQIGVRNRALADQLQETKWRTAMTLEARGMASATALQIANQRQNLALGMEAMRERASDKREFQREGFAASMKATGDLLASYDRTLKDASSLTATQAQRDAAAKLLTGGTDKDGHPVPSPYDAVVQRLQTIGVNMPTQESTDAVQSLQNDTYAAAMAGTLDPTMGGQPTGGMDPASISATVAAAVSGALAGRGAAGGGLGGPGIAQTPAGGTAPAYPGAAVPPGPAATPAAVAAGAGFNDNGGRTDITSGHVSPNLINALSVAEKAGYKLQITAVRSDHGPDGQAGHEGGNAADVGTINGTTVGFNPVTWKFISDAIGSNTVTKVGTIAQIANNPTMQQYARQHGVMLFVDEGTAPHVHLQVAAGAPPAANPAQPAQPAQRQPLKANPLRPGAGPTSSAATVTQQQSVPPAATPLTPQQVGQQTVALYDRAHAGEPFDKAWGAISNWLIAHGATKGSPDLQAAETALRAHVKQQEDAKALAERARLIHMQNPNMPPERVQELAKQQVAGQANAALPSLPSPGPQAGSPVELARAALMNRTDPQGNVAPGTDQMILQQLAGPPWRMTPQAAQAALAAAKAQGQRQPALAGR